MKKYIGYLLLAVVLIIAVNAYFNLTIYQRQLAFQRNIMFSQLEKTSDEIEAELLQFQNDVNSILFSSVIDNIHISSNDTDQEGLKILEVLFTKYNELVRTISILDNLDNSLNISLNTRDAFLVDAYKNQKSNVLRDSETVEKTGSLIEYTIPVYNGQAVTSNIVFTLNLEAYFATVFNRYLYDNTFWQWIMDKDGNIIFSNLSKETTYSQQLEISGRANIEIADFIMHKAVIDGREFKLMSAYYPLAIYSHPYAVVFSMKSSIILDLIIKRMIIAGTISLAVLLIYVILLMGKLGSSFSLKAKADSDLSKYNLIFDHLPVGIMVADLKGRARIMNQVAKDLLLIKSNDEYYGKNMTDRFMLSKDYYDASSSETAYDSDQFVVYRNEGEEVSVYKKELPFTIDQEDLVLSAFVDVSHIEKSRKYEEAANNAKSEFLAKMSHEIRTPMNGIIGMTDALKKGNLTNEQQENVDIIKKSADLLLNLIDDILDFSKIEAGKMQIEEIPFRLREEIQLSLDLFRPIIEGKGLGLTLNINPEIPDHIISDPFRLRQILSNLISNAIKFTPAGEIAVTVNLTEQYDNNLTLLFTVEDTGVGIQRDKIDAIFNSFTQAEESTSRKYGGSGLGTTIVKQLVNLMNGEVWVESPSTLSKDSRYPGSRFGFTLEMYSNERLSKDFNFDALNDVSQIHVLLICNNPPTRHRLIRMLEHEKFQYELFEQEDETYDKLKQKLKDRTGAYHILMILDDTRLDGMKLAKSLDDDKLTKEYLMIMISANHKHDNYIQSKRSGIDHYLLEPFESIDVISCMLDYFPNVYRTATEASNIALSGLSILIAEDNDINIKVAETIFSNLGLSIDVARNGSEVVEKVRKNPYDIVFMDLVMPETDGMQATVEIRGSGYQMPIIAMTATASSSTKSKAISSGMNDYIVKPVKSETIRNILLKWFG